MSLKLSKALAFEMAITSHVIIKPIIETIREINKSIVHVN